MSLFDTHSEREYLGRGTYRHVQHVKPIAYRDGGSLRRISTTWRDSGIQGRPHLVDAAPFSVSVSNDGDVRYHPTRDPDVWFQIGDPVYRIGGDARRFELGTPERIGNRLRWLTQHVRMDYLHAGHVGKLGMLFRTDAYQHIDDREFGFPLTYRGCARQGAWITVDGARVMRLRPFRAYDYETPTHNAAITHDFRTVGGTEYVVVTLPLAMDGWAKPVLDPTFETQPDPTDGKDTYIDDTTANEPKNYGTATNIEVGTGAAAGRVRRGLLQFDVSSLAGATATTATLSLYWHGGLGDNDNVRIAVHRAIVPWYEGSKNGANPDVGEDASTWQHRNANGSVAWDGGAGGGSGSDYQATATDDDRLEDDVGGCGIGWHEWDVLADVQAWLAGNSNYGWFLISNTEGSSNEQRNFYASDETTETDSRPKLTVEYTLPASGLTALLRRQRS